MTYLEVESVEDGALGFPVGSETDLGRALLDSEVGPDLLNAAGDGTEAGPPVLVPEALAALWASWMARRSALVRAALGSADGSGGPRCCCCCGGDGLTGAFKAAGGPTAAAGGFDAGGCWLLGWLPTGEAAGGWRGRR